MNKYFTTYRVASFALNGNTNLAQDLSGNGGTTDSTITLIAENAIHLEKLTITKSITGNVDIDGWGSIGGSLSNGFRIYFKKNTNDNEICLTGEPGSADSQIRSNSDILKCFDTHEYEDYGSGNAFVKGTMNLHHIRMDETGTVIIRFGNDDFRGEKTTVEGIYANLYYWSR